MGFPGFQVQVHVSSLNTWSCGRTGGGGPAGVLAATRWSEASGSKSTPQGSFQQQLQPLAGVTGNLTPLADFFTPVCLLLRDRKQGETMAARRRSALVAVLLVTMLLPGESSHDAV